jgi:uncharacterized protein (TIRG00374 family)
VISGRGRYLGYAVSAVIVLGIAFTFDWREAGASLRRFNYSLLIPALALYLFAFAIRGVRWQCMLAPLKRISFGSSFSVVMVGFMANNILPLRIGEFVRAWALKRKEGVSSSAGFATIVLERVYDGLTLVGFLVLVLLFGTTTRTIRLYGAVGAAVFLCAFGALLYAAFRQEHARRAAGVMTSLLPGRLRERANRLVDSFLPGLSFLSSGSRQAAVVSLSVVVWLVEAGGFWMIMRGFADLADVPAYAALFTLAIVNIAIMIPAAPGYIGTFDAAAIVALAPFRVERATAISYIIVVHALQYLSVTSLGLYYMNASGWSLREIEGAEKV